MYRDQIRTNPRVAGMVRRYHTWPILRQQTVGEHSYHAMRIWFQMWGELPPRVSTHFIWHDAGELVVGDLPYPVKSQNPKLKAMVDDLEADAVLDMGGRMEELSPGDCVRAKLCDYIEMWEFGMLEVAMGNRFAEPIVRDLAPVIKNIIEQLPEYYRATAQRYVEWMEAKCT